MAHPIDYSEDSIRSLDWKEHIRLRPGMYIGKLGDGCDIRQNYRPFMQQSNLKVNHIHFHVIPRSLNNYIYTVSEKYDTELFADLDDMERDAVAKLLK